MKRSLLRSQRLSLALTAVLLVLMWLPNIHPIGSEYFEAYRLIFQTIISVAFNPFESAEFINIPFASTLAAVFNSPILGLQLSTLLSVVSLWGFTLAIIWSLPARVALFSTAILTCITIFDKHLFGLGIVGSALGRQFDIGHLSNQMIALVIIAICLFFEPNKKAYLLKLPVLVLLITFASAIASLASAPEIIIFSLSAASLIFASMLLGSSCDRLFTQNNRAFWFIQKLDSPISMILIPIGSLYVLVSATMPIKSELDVRSISRVDEALLEIQRIDGARDLSKDNWIISPLANLPAIIPRLLNYAVATSAVTDERLLPMDLISLAKKEAFHWLITDQPEVPFFLHTCLKGAVGTLSAYESECVNRTLQQHVACSGSFDLSKAGHVDSTLFKGLSEAEDHGRWTEGNRVYFGCIVRGVTPKHLVLNMRGFTYGPLTAQRLIARVNGDSPQEFLISTQREVRLNIPALTEGSVVIVDIVLPDAISPRNLGLSADARHLAVTIKTATFTFD